jgi:hypothetical protein
LPPLNARLFLALIAIKLQTLGIRVCKGLQPDKKCYNCGQKGHIAIACPNPRSRPPLTPTPNSAPPLNRNGNSNSVQGRQNYAQGRVNQLAMEEAQNAPMNGTFLINSYSILTIPWPSFFSALRISRRDSL